MHLVNELCLDSKVFLKKWKRISGNGSGGMRMKNNKLTVYFDYVCPYCYRGLSDLMELLVEFPQIEVKWVPCEAHPYPDSMMGIYSSKACQAMLIVEAHGGNLIQFHKEIFQAHFKLRRRIDEPEVLAEIGAKCNVPYEIIIRELNSKIYAEQVLQNNDLVWEKLGCQAVPDYIAGEKALLSFEDVSIPKKKLRQFLSLCFSDCNYGNLRNLSKYMSLILRHKPETIGISLDEHGWADVDELVEGIAKKKRFNRDILEEIVRTDNKQRYSFNESKTLIRANQGHSIPVDVELDEVVPPKFLWHGTAEQSVSSINKQGLLSMGRLYVHLSKDEGTALKVGSRHGKPVIYRVKSGKMAKDGHVFYLSKNGVWLTKKVPVEYLEKEWEEE